MKLKNIDTWLFKNKEGMGIGFLAGAAVYYFKWNIPFLIFKYGTSESTKFASLVFIGMTVGALIDNFWRPSK